MNNEIKSNSVFSRVLNTDENITGYTKKNPIILILGIFLFLAVILACFIASDEILKAFGKKAEDVIFIHEGQLYYVEENEGIVDIFIYLWLSGISLSVSPLVASIKIFLSDRFAVTDKKRLLLKVRRANLPINIAIENISEVKVKRGVFGRFFNYGTILIYMKKEISYAKYIIKSKFVTNPVDLADKVKELTAIFNPTI